MSAARLLAIGLADLRASLRRRWVVGAGLLGILVSAAVAVVAAAGSGRTVVDRLHTGAFNLLLLGGVAVAIGLGATTVNRDAERGFIGLLHTSGAGRPEIALGRALGRLAVLIALIAVWSAALQVASLAIGEGVDGPMALLGLATVENAGLILLIAAAASTVVGAGTAGTTAAIAFAMLQALTNLGAAADQRVIRSVWRGVSDAVTNVLPQQVHTRLSAALVNRGDGGPAGQRFEVNGLFAYVAPSGWLTVLWTGAWCAAFAALIVAGMRNRSI